MMKKYTSVILLILFVALLNSCKYKLSYNHEGMEQLKVELNKKFGEQSWYSEITILNKDDKETMIRVQQTDDLNSLRGKSWVKYSDSWNVSDEIMYQFMDNQPENHLFQLGNPMSLNTLADLIVITEEKMQEVGVTNYSLNFASIQSAENVKRSDERFVYTVSFKDLSNAKSMSFVFDVNGKPIAVNQ